MTIRQEKKEVKQRGVFEKVPRSGEWWIRYTDAAGLYRREKAGTKANAIKLYGKRKNEALQGKKLPETLRRAPASFREIAEDALAWSDQHKRSARNDHKLMKKLLAWFGDKPAESIAPSEVEAKFQGEPWTPATWNRYRALLSLTYRLAIRNGKAKENPARLVRHKTEHNERVRFLSVEEEKKLRKTIREMCPERELEFDLALQTGMRLGEQYGARWEHVDLERRLLTIPRDKGGRTSHVQLNDAALSALAHLRQRTWETGVVCGGVKGPRHWFKEVLKTTGIVNFSWHCLRHTFASRLVMASVDVRTVAELLRDRTLAMVMRYAHLAPDHKLEAVRRMEQHFRFGTDTTAALAENGGSARVN